MELKDFHGEYWLQGVEFVSWRIYQSYKWDTGELGTRGDDANVMIVLLSGVAFAFIENPDDGYRSSMEEVSTTDVNLVKNRFAGNRVIAKASDDKYKDVVYFVDVVTGKEVVVAGTDYSEDYYPAYVASFMPENMSVNAGKVDEVNDQE